MLQYYAGHAEPKEECGSINKGYRRNSCQAAVRQIHLGRHDEERSGKKAKCG
jgi:hypothetical protein